MSAAEAWASKTGRPIADWDDLAPLTQRIVELEVNAGRYLLTDAEMDARASGPVVRNRRDR